MNSPEQTEVVEIFTDGACRGNPGPGGWGALLRCGPRCKEIYGAQRTTTNNRMELMAAINALAALQRPSRVRLFTDSKYVIDGITQWLSGWKQREWKTAARNPVKNVDLWRRLDTVAERHDIAWHWVKGHSGHAENEAADQLANRAIDEMLADHRT